MPLNSNFILELTPSFSPSLFLLHSDLAALEHAPASECFPYNICGEDSSWLLSCHLIRQSPLSIVSGALGSLPRPLSPAFFLAAPDPLPMKRTNLC